MTTFLNPLTDNETYYEVLDLSPSASPAEVREAYLRAKSAYNKDSVALYSLIESKDREDILRRIEEAYEVLSNEDKRRIYDAHHGIIENTGALEAGPVPPPPPRLAQTAKVVSIDRVPPMDSRGSEDEILVAPATDFANTELPEIAIAQNPAPTSVTGKASADNYIDVGRQRAPRMSPDIEQEILDETQWQGIFLRRVREAQNVSIEELSNITKISKSYIQAIEQDDYKKLPALVFTRGFLVQICRMLKLPQERVLDAYLQRFNSAKLSR